MKKIFVFFVLLSGMLVGCRDDIDEPYHDPVHAEVVSFSLDDYSNALQSDVKIATVSDGLEWYDGYLPDSSNIQYDAKNKVLYYDNLIRLCVLPDALDRVMDEILPGAKVRGYDANAMCYLVEFLEHYDYNDICAYCDMVYNEAEQKDHMSRDFAYYVVSVQPFVVNE